MPRAYLDIGPLFENHWTGIPVVTAALAECALSDTVLDWHFLYETVLISRPVVEQLLRQRSGGSQLAHVEQQHLSGAFVSKADAGKSACLFPNVKAKRRYFGREGLLVHDFSTLLTPEFHNQDTINHHARRLRGDISSTDYFFCNSRATLTDLRFYFGIPAERCCVLPFGLSVDPADLTWAIEMRAAFSRDPYICVLGTIEPRKNGAIVFRMLSENPLIAKTFKFVFIGRDGWNDEKNRLLTELAELGIDSSRIIFTGFVSERQKLALLLGSAFCLYPSFFEGYGLPIAEAAALGKYIVCSATSSMKEVAPDMCYFFDPGDASSLSTAFARAELAWRATRLHCATFSDLWPRILARSWSGAYEVIAQWASNVVEGT